MQELLTQLPPWAVSLSIMVLMVALGLSGVLWQNVTQRIRELGLRRAKGADRARIRRQIFTEIALMTGIAIVVSALLLAQVPMLGWLGSIPTSVYVSSLFLAAVLLFLLTSFCGWYPSLLATRIPPAEAVDRSAPRQRHPRRARDQHRDAHQRGGPTPGRAEQPAASRGHAPMLPRRPATLSG